MSEVVTGADGRTLSARGVETRQRLLDAAEQVFGGLGYHDASIVKITEAAGVGQGTFYLYFASKQDVFDELVRDLNRRIRHAMSESASSGSTRLEQETLGFRGYFEFAVQHPGLYKIIRQSAFVSPEIFRWHYDRVSEPYVASLQRAIERGELGPIDPEVAAWALMAVGEMIGMRWIVWGEGSVPDGVAAELARIIGAVWSRVGDARLARRDRGVPARALDDRGRDRSAKRYSDAGDRREVRPARQARRRRGRARERPLGACSGGTQWLAPAGRRQDQAGRAAVPSFDYNLAESFKRETELFFDSIVREDRNILDLLTADYTFVNGGSRCHYAIPNVMGDQFRKVTLGPEFAYRRGLLGQGSILMQTSVADRTSPCSAASG